MDICRKFEQKQLRTQKLLLSKNVQWLALHYNRRTSNQAQPILPTVFRPQVVIQEVEESEGTLQNGPLSKNITQRKLSVMHLIRLSLFSCLEISDISSRCQHLTRQSSCTPFAKKKHAFYSDLIRDIILWTKWCPSAVLVERDPLRLFGRFEQHVCGRSCCESLLRLPTEITHCFE